jgi:hypothetical protein
MDDCDEDHAWLVELVGFDEAQVRLTGTCSPCKKQTLAKCQHDRLCMFHC